MWSTYFMKKIHWCKAKKEGKESKKEKFIYFKYISCIYKIYSDSKMVQAMINISKEANQILNIIKAKYDLKDKSQAIEKITNIVDVNYLEPELQPQFISKIKSLQGEKTMKIKNFNKHFGV